MLRPARWVVIGLKPVLPAIRKAPSHTILNPERLWRRA